MRKKRQPQSVSCTHSALPAPCFYNKGIMAPAVVCNSEDLARNSR
jgi:hypothetical protein